MLRWLVPLLAALAFFAVPVVPAHASAAVSYDPGNFVYGWCAGYSSSRAASCAQQECENGGNTCQQVLACGGGWGAIAFPEAPGGIAAICGVGDAMTARQQALAACVVANDSLCWTDSTFDQNANQRSKDDNLNFDLVWYAQSLLQLDGYTSSGSDGVIGPATRAALAKFDAAIGRDATSTIDDETVRRLLDSEQGIHRFAQLLKNNIVDPAAPHLVGKSFAVGPSPLADASFTDELLQRSDDDRRLALATLLDVNNSPCTVPAKSATLMGDATSNSWDVGCAEADYTVILNASGSVLVMGGPAAAPVAPPPATDATPAPAVPDTPALAAPGPANPNVPSEPPPQQQHGSQQ